MQPQDNYTGYSQQPAAGQGIPPVPPQAPLPTIENTAPTTMRSNSAVQSPQYDSIEHWASEVEKILLETSQNPHARAKAIADIKGRYQQQILGLKSHAKGD